jgi:hypothetical protein
MPSLVPALGVPWFRKGLSLSPLAVNRERESEFRFSILSPPLCLRGGREVAAKALAGDLSPFTLVVVVGARAPSLSRAIGAVRRGAPLSKRRRPTAPFPRESLFSSLRYVERYHSVVTGGPAHPLPFTRSFTWPPIARARLSALQSLRALPLHSRECVCSLSPHLPLPLVVWMLLL